MAPGCRGPWPLAWSTPRVRATASTARISPPVCAAPLPPKRPRPGSPWRRKSSGIRALLYPDQAWGDLRRPPGCANAGGQIQPGRKTVLFDGLKAQAPDALLALIGLFAADPRSDKIDLGVGVYRDETGATPVFRAVKAAEARLVEAQASKSYLGPEGDIRFTELLQPIVFGGSVDPAPPVGIQTPGGTGALRLAAELIAAAKPRTKVWLGTPTWPN